MKRWIRRIITVCAIALLSVMLAACGKTGEEEIDPVLEQELINSAVQDVTGMIRLGEDEIDEYIDQFNADQDTVKANGFNSWKNARKDLGEFIQFETTDVTQDAKGYTVTINANFEKRDCEIIFGVNKRLTEINNLAFNPVYSLSEKMGQAGINLIIGMGTVFAVLIFLTWIISLFKYVNKAQTKFEDSRKAKSENAEGQEVSDAADAEAVQQEAVSDAADEELQAVIAAAVAAYEADSKSGIEKQAPLNNGLSVRSFRRGGDR